MNKKLKTMVFIGLFSAIIGILSQIAIPMFSGVSFTLQTFAIALAGYCLGSKNGTISVVIYLLLGAVGVPVFTGFQGGIAKLTGVTGGFLFGFILLVICCGLPLKKTYQRIILGIVGLALCHLFGVIQFSFVTENTLWQSFMVASLPYLLKDVISLILALKLSDKLKTIIK
ncbi:MAG: biotin transporter BioY [Acutalibacteraceae bacterium]